MIGDNGASAEGTLNGAFNEMANFNGMAALETPEFMLSRWTSSAHRTPTTTTRSAGPGRWTPRFQWTKQVASHWGGTRNRTIVHWPSGIEQPGGLRSQFTHVIDVAPTILEAAGLPEPTMVNGVQQSPMEAACCTASTRRMRRSGWPTNNEMFANRGIYHRSGARSRSTAPMVMVGGKMLAFDDDVWELYDGTTDYSQARNLGRATGDAGRAAAALADPGRPCNVLPMDDRTAGQVNPGDSEGDRL